MTPIELFTQNIDYWHSSSGLRKGNTDCQIMGYEYSSEGVFCDLFLKHAPEAREIEAQWKDNRFQWKDNEGIKQVSKHMPQPVRDWISRHHGEKVGERVAICLGYLRKEHVYGLESAAALLGVAFLGPEFFEDLKGKIKMPEEKPRLVDQSLV